jgi:formylglycine-generating enzyme required for sulfatase activity
MLPVPAGAPVIEGHGAASVRACWIAKTETTWDLYDVFAYRLDEPDAPAPTDADAETHPTRPYLPPDRGFGHAGFPAISISYGGAEAFCRWLSGKTGRAYRLPTEAEWQWAASAGGAPRLPLDEIAWFAGNSGRKTHAVATKRANAWGFHDALGNAAEWAVGLDGKPVTCGGSYLDPAERIGATCRAPFSPRWNASDPQIPKSRWWLADAGFVGFRVACDGPKPEPTETTR